MSVTKKMFGQKLILEEFYITLRGVKYILRDSIKEHVDPMSKIDPTVPDELVINIRNTSVCTDLQVKQFMKPLLRCEKLLDEIDVMLSKNLSLSMSSLRDFDDYMDKVRKYLNSYRVSVTRFNFNR